LKRFDCLYVAMECCTWLA